MGARLTKSKTFSSSLALNLMLRSSGDNSVHPAIRCSPSLKTLAELVSTTIRSAGSHRIALRGITRGRMDKGEREGDILAALLTRESWIKLDASELCRFWRNSLKTPKFL